MMERKYTEAITSVPLRKLAKIIEVNRKAVSAQRMNGQMNPITKHGGMPKPAGRV
jgi:hypothetical protein